MLEDRICGMAGVGWGAMSDRGPFRNGGVSATGANHRHPAMASRSFKKSRRRRYGLSFSEASPARARWNSHSVGGVMHSQMGLMQ